MFLRSLTVENLRSIASAELEFGSPRAAPQRWSMLLGENGSGKSTLLRAIAMVMAGRSALPSFLTEPAGWIRNGAKAARVSATLVTANGEKRTIALTIRRDRDVATILEENQKSLEELDWALNHTHRSYFTVGYGVARRLSRELTREPQPARFANVATLFTADALLHSIETWSTDLHYRLGKRGEAVVRTTLEGLLPDAQFEGIDRENRRILFRTADGVVPLGQLSDAYQSVAAWAGDLLFRITETFKDYERPLEARGLLLMDEIELHLHPRVQRSLRRFLQTRFPNFQFIATTHSALTAQQSSEGELWIVDRERGSHVQRYPGNPQRLQVQHLLLSDAFGLDSLSSPQAEAYLRLRRKKQLTADERVELAKLHGELRADGDPLPERAGGEPLHALLERIDRAVAGRAAKATALGKPTVVVQAPPVMRKVAAAPRPSPPRRRR